MLPEAVADDFGLPGGLVGGPLWHCFVTLAGALVQTAAGCRCSWRLKRSLPVWPTFLWLGAVMAHGRNKTHPFVNG